MDGVNLTPLKKIAHPKGDIFHALKKSDLGFAGFGEAYFSSIIKGDVKGWKKHKQMILNLVVIIGKIEFIVHDNENFFSVILSKKNYQRLTISPGLWVAFRGLSDENVLLNIANIEHKENESENIDLNSIDYGWD
jgi:dTDP-4-dehydrorhamnose 3,5-epimerase